MCAMVGRRLLFVIGFACTLISGCSRKESGSDTGERPHATDDNTAIATSAAALNPNPQVADFVLFATNSMSVGTSVSVNGGDIGVKNAGTGPLLVAGFELAIGGLSQVNTARNLLADSIQLGASSVVGDVQTNQLNDLGSTHGPVTPFLAMPELPAVAAVTPGTMDRNIAANTVTTLAANLSYRNLTIGNNAIVRLSGGIYQLAQLTIGQNVRLEALAASEVRISGKLSAATTSIIGPASGTSLSANDLRIEVSGINGTTGALTATPPAASFVGSNQVRALVLVPNGLLSMGSSSQIQGALFARDVRINNTAQITYQDGFANSAGCPPSCDDGNPCTTDACVSNACTHTPVAPGTSCSDGNACNGAETCSASGTCQSGTPVVCSASDQCHAVGTCDTTTGACSNPVKVDGTACNDGNGCTQTDTCQAGTCAGANPVACTASDSCHEVGTCEPTTGACSNPTKPDGTACSDGNACTQSDTCHAGACTGVNPVTCTAMDACHVAGTCEPSTGQCTNPAAPDGTACSDGNACTQSDSCLAGTCAGMNPVTCTAMDACHVAGTCEPGTGQCSNPAAPDGTTCSDGNACTQSDTCQAGTCTGSNPVACTASDSCHEVGTCNPTTGVCSNPTKPDGTACSDGNACTQSDSCQAGTCTGANPVTCTASDACHVAGTCEPGTGQCSNPAAPDGTACSDGNACTQSDSCQAGACTGSNPITCTASDACHVAGTCDTSTGQCSNPAAPDGTACTDGNACTQSDTCQAGTCTGANPVTCTAMDACHIAGTCEPGTGQCSNPSAPDGTACTDGNACTQSDSCQAGTCTGSNPVTCTASDACHVSGTCEPGTGQCSNPAAPDGTACSEGNVCTQTDACQAGTCVGATPVTCAASDQCHLAGTCDPTTGCSNPSAPDGTACSDGNACTQSDMCQAGACTGANPVICTALDTCHVAGSCNPTDGTCTNPNAPEGTSCDDSNSCTQVDSCQTGACVGANPITCAASDSCHLAGTCDPGSGLCSNPAAPDGTACSVGGGCTTNDACQAGACQAGTPVAIDDGDPCTLDTCDPVNGIVHHACTTINRTVGTTLADSTGFIYTGTNPVQTGVAPGTIVPARAVALRGRILDRAGAALPGASVTIADHPEFGSTRTQGDGRFDMVANGGQPLRLRIQASGYLPAERQVAAPWQEYVAVPDVVVIPLDTQVTTVDLPSQSDIAVARGSTVNDSDGTRRATLLVKPGTQAVMTLPNNSTIELETIHVRATEFTVGANGPSAMPAELPSTSAYTYAVELSIDEALNAGATEVAFSQPIPFYVENFLGFPVGEAVPAGYYDRQKGAWVASDNGRIIKVLSITSGSADLDVTGDNVADSGAPLTTLGITEDERQRLASLYAPGQSLWRIPVAHFSEWDANWGFFPPPGAAPPNGPDPDDGDDGDGPGDCRQSGSVIECQRQALGEDVSVVGTPFKLHYQSDRQLGRRSALKIALSGPTLPGPVLRIDLVVSIAGRVFTQSFPAAPNQTTTFLWDGKDAFGRLVQGRQPIGVRIGNVYQGVYQRIDRFGGFGAGMITGSQTRQEIILWRDWRSVLGNWDSRAEGLGGFTLSAHRTYDAEGREIHHGNGTNRTPAFLPGVVQTIAGIGISDTTGDGGPAKLAAVRSPESVRVAPDGSIYINSVGFCIRRVNPNGIIQRIIGNCATSGFEGDGGPAINAKIRAATDIAFGPDGSLYIADNVNHRIRKVDPAGIISTVVGSGPIDGFGNPVGGFAGDGGPATQARLNRPRGVDVAADGTIYIVDGDNNRVRRVTPDGIINTVAGNGSGACSALQNVPATTVPICAANKVRAGADGSFYISEFNGEIIRRVGTDGVIRPFAGNGQFGYSGDGGPATAAQIRSPADIVLGRDNSLYILDQNRTIRRVGPDGIINTIIGHPSRNIFVGEGGPAAAAGIAIARGLDVAPDGTIYIADSGNGRVRSIAPPLPGFTLATAPFTFPSEDGTVVDVFDGLGRHVETRDAFTQAVLYRFGYDSAGRLASVTDVDDNVTQIEHDAAGNPTRIVAPFGQITTLGVDANGYLSSVSNPAGDTTQFTYSAEGLMSTMIDPRGGHYTFDYETDGRLKFDGDPAGGSKALVRTDDASGFNVTMTTALGRTTTYRTQRSNTGTLTRLNTLPSGLQTSFSFTKSGTTAATLPNGMSLDSTQTADPRFGMLSPLLGTSTKTPAGLTRTESMSRSATFTGGGTTLATLTEALNASGDTWTRVFNASTRTWTTTSPAGRKQFMTLDAKSHASSTQIDGLLARTFGYDPRGRVSSMTQGPRTYGFAYASDGFLESTTDPAGRTTQFLRDAAGRVTTTIEPGAAQIVIGYDRNGNMTSVTPPSKPTHGMSYSPVNLLASYDPPAVASSGLTSTTYAHDLDRLLSQVLRPDNNTVGYAYDTAGRLSTITLPTGVITYGYSPTTGKLATLNGPTGEALTFGYDGDLLTDVAYAGPISGALHWTFDNRFRVTSETVNGGLTANFGYDGDGLLTTAGALTLTPGPQNGLLAGTALGSVTDSYGYNAHGEVTSYTAQYQATPLYSITYTRDALGRIDTKTETVQGTTHVYGYTYDPRGRLTDVTTDGIISSHYDYDGNGNRLARTTPSGTTSGTYDAQDRLLTYGSNVYAYGANGELTSKTDTSNGQTTQYVYDAMGALTRVVLPAGTAIDYVIDGSGRRIGKKLNGTLVQGFLYSDQLRIAAETDGAGNIVSRFVYTTRPNVPEYMLKNGEMYRLITDHLGSVRLVVKVSDGAVAQRLDYDELGAVLNDTAAGLQTFGFAGGLQDQHTTFIRLGTRDYDATIGVWRGKDKIFLRGGPNLYAYLSGDPINKIDPMGWYGTNDCGYYEQRCRENGGTYYCVDAPKWCRRFPTPPDPNPDDDFDNEGWARCTRQCLQDADRDRRDSRRDDRQNVCSSESPNNSGPWNPFNPLFDDHVKCYLECFFDNSHDWLR